MFVCACCLYFVTHLWTCASDRGAKAKVEDLGEMALGLVGAYYEDHIQPVIGSYAEWVSNVRSSMWEKIQTSIDNYMPFKANNATD